MGKGDWPTEHARCARNVLDALQVGKQVQLTVVCEAGIENNKANGKGLTNEPRNTPSSSPGLLDSEA